MSEKISSLEAGTCKLTDTYVAVDITDPGMAPTGTDKRYTLQQITDFIQLDLTPINFIDVWNATTNTPGLFSAVGSPGDLYIVNVAGNHNLNGITVWDVGDWVLFGATNWEKVPGMETGNVFGPATSTANAIARYDDTSGTILLNSTVTIDDTGVFTGATITGVGNSVTAIALATTGADVIINTSVPPEIGQALVAISATEAAWQSNPFGDVTGPPGSTDEAIARWHGTSGDIIQNSPVLLSDTGVMTGVTLPSAGNTVSAGRLTTTGADVVISSANPPTLGQVLTATSATAATWQNQTFTGPPSATNDAIVRFDGTTGTVVQNSNISISDTGILSGATIPKTNNSVTCTALATTGADVVISGSAPPGAGYFLATDSATTASWKELVPGSGDVVGPSVSTDSAIALYDGDTGVVIKNSNWIVGQIDAATDASLTTTATQPLNWSIGVETYNTVASTFFISTKNGAFPKEEYLTISPTGNLTLPSSCAFQAIRTTPVHNVTGDGSLYNFTFQTEVYDLNGNFGDFVNFIAPVSGVYHFTLMADYESLVPSTEQIYNLSIIFRVNNINHTMLFISPAGISVQPSTILNTNGYFYMQEGQLMTSATIVQGLARIVGIRAATLSGRLCN